VFHPAGSTKKRVNRLKTVLVAAWLLHDPWFRDRRQFGAPAYAFLAKGLDGRAGLVPAAALVCDPDRRGEGGRGVPRHPHSWPGGLPRRNRRKMRSARGNGTTKESNGACLARIPLLPNLGTGVPFS